eukprot:GFKZ01015554.1.p1 GENE.GFKZ01015554.1~~GFKZ01015554.1.p1  ORF type:complete len:115 (-),score=19.08 GFKZ01015554.1:54-368(-)
MNAESAWLIGSDMALILTADLPVTFNTHDGTEIGSTTTNMMGAYEYQLMTSDIPEGTTEVKVMHDGNVIRTVSVVNGDSASSAPTHVMGYSMVAMVFGLLASFI